MQRIEIKNFGPIKNIQLDIKDYMVFIGPQASGKSTISKSIYFFKSLRDDIVRYIREGLEQEKFDKAPGIYAKSIRRKFLNFWGPTRHLKDLEMCYYYKHNIWIKITLDNSGNYIDPSFSPDFDKAFKQIISAAESFLKSRYYKNKGFLSSKDLIEFDSEKRQFFNKLDSLANDLFGDHKDLLFIPAGRSLLATLSDQLQNIHPHNLDYLMRNFIDRINTIKPLFNKNLEELVIEKRKLSYEVIDSKRVDFAIQLIQKILKGRYQFDKEGEKIYFENNRYTKISYSSSGQQESIWILLLLFLLILEKQEVFIVIEEPEAHLYPEAQKQMIDIITLIGNFQRNQVIITTHSPYVLSSVSNLIYAHEVGNLNDNNKQKVAERISPFLWISLEKVEAYFIDKEEFRNILDKELRSIAVEEIDSASQFINADYEFLFDME